MKLESTNPSKGYEVIGAVEAISRHDIMSVITTAHLTQPQWAAMSLAERCKAFNSFVEVCKGRLGDIAQISAEETGRPIASLRGLAEGTIDYFNTYIEMAEDSLAPKITFENDKEVHRVYREPRGVIAVIAPWNYPFLNFAFQCAQALIAGNTIVYKHSEESPLYSKLLAELVDQSDLPDGVFNVVYGDGAVGETLARADVDMIAFTGSTKVGKKLAGIAAEKLIPISTELGGSSPCVVFEDTEITDDLVSLVYNLRFINAGQSCDALKRLIVHESKFDELVDRLAKIAPTKKIGDAQDESTDMGPLVAERQLLRAEEQVQDAVAKGANVVIGGKRPEGLEGAYYEPTILTNVTKDMRVWHEETFAPILPVVSFETEEEAIELANDTEYGLSAFVMTSNKERYERVARQLEAGMIAHNDVMFWSPRNPFGGYKQSGLGRTHGEWGFDEVTQVKVVSEKK